MSVTGVTNPLLNNLGTIARPAARPGVAPGRAGVAGGATPSAAPALRPQPSLAAPANALPAEAPAGTDPELWNVLTSDERAFFAKAASNGPITYGRVAARLNTMNGFSNQAAPPARGVRLDVRA